MGRDVTQTEIAALLAVAQDYAFGQAPGSQLRATVLGQRLAAALDADAAERATTWWTSALRFLGCTGHAFEVAVVFGDEIELRAQSLRADFANPVDVLRLTISHAGSGQSGAGRLRSVLAVRAGGRKAAEMNSAPPARSPMHSPSGLAWARPSAPRWPRPSSVGTAVACPPGRRAAPYPVRRGSPT